MSNSPSTPSASRLPAPAPGATDLKASPAAPDRLLRIQEVAVETGLTARAIRYYEELGLLAPAARSEGAYRLYDDEDLERLRFIRGLRDDAGFSLGEIGQLLEDEHVRARNRAQFRATRDPGAREALLQDGLARIERQVATLRRKIDRLEGMVAKAQERRVHLAQHLEAVRGGLATDHPHDTANPQPDADPREPRR